MILNTVFMTAEHKRESSEGRCASHTSTRASRGVRPYPEIELAMNTVSTSTRRRERSSWFGRSRQSRRRPSKSTYRLCRGYQKLLPLLCEASCHANFKMGEEPLRGLNKSCCKIWFRAGLSGQRFGAVGKGCRHGV